MIRITSYKSFVAGLLTLFLVTACSEDFLEKKPLGQLSSETFFSTSEHAVLSTNAVYNLLRNWSVHVFSFIGTTDIISDDADKGSSPNDANFLLEVDNFTFDPGNIAFSGVWSGYYRGIYRTNLAIQEIPNIEMDENLKARLIGENKFLRAYFYLSLVRWFGDIPLILEPLNPDEYEQARDPKADVFAAIEQDLLDAIDALPESYPPADIGRATKGAAQGLLARTYLTTGNFTGVRDMTEAIINSGQYDLYPNYTQLFQPIGENSVESVFEVQAEAFEVGGGGTQYNEVQGVRGIPNLGWGFNRPSDDLVAAYETGDPRRDATIFYPGEVLPDGSDIISDNPNIVGERYNQKAWVPEHPGGNGNGPGNIRLIRYADVLLMAAEAHNELGNPMQALEYLNMVRTRARGTRTNVLPDITETNQDALRDIIWRERRVELAMEQQRWFDIVRQGRAAEVMQGVGKPFVEGKHEVLPIPQTEIDLSGALLTQNPGYN